jgi:hypothetical protein
MATATKKLLPPQPPPPPPRFDLCRVFREKHADEYCLMLLWFFDGGWKGDRRPSAW